MRLATLSLALLLTLPAQAATVLSVGDGDTLRVDDRGKRLTIRLACIDAPEMAQGPYGQQSQALLTSLAPIGAEVRLKVVDTDRYGRSVAEIRRSPIASTSETATPPPISALNAARRWTAWGCGVSPEGSSGPGIFGMGAVGTGRRRLRALVQKSCCSLDASACAAANSALAQGAVDQR